MNTSQNKMASRKRNELPYLLGLGALTGGVVSAAYLVFVSPALAAGVVPLPLLFGLLLTFLVATILNSLLMGVILTLRFGTTGGLSDYFSGALIGSVVTYATIVFYFISLV
ncbi:MAG: hypothetical protein OK438_03350 [Thaumarchaeota archaeon]|nr:hypothetical protein [Nitrososphaerota archaeon]